MDFKSDKHLPLTTFLSFKNIVDAIFKGYSSLQNPLQLHDGFYLSQKP